MDILNTLPFCVNTSTNELCIVSVRSEAGLAWNTSDEAYEKSIGKMYIMYPNGIHYRIAKTLMRRATHKDIRSLLNNSEHIRKEAFKRGLIRESIAHTI